MQTADPFLPVLRLRLREGGDGLRKLVNKLVGKAQSKLPRKRKSAQAIQSPPVGAQISFFFSPRDGVLPNSNQTRAAKGPT
ncbi:hypothetical protein H105_05994 [Trichophyton soudanense CBS 452.61]|uniref:Uncharacterized protein n=1 Tax=Trichophyton soudanense CBS 452.61 TaxID=1215331 RepID=A0A022XMD2_TRISD|nr:hypothetical protein H100_05985 [Trichophyton rubrum MR850]EZF71842.1 hypothetical protein H105_05994 [Trichophyton soudanense CBS 452.61]